MRVHVHACIKSARIMKRNIDEHYVGFDLLQNAKSSLNNSVKVKNWVILFGRPEPFKASFCEIIYRLIEIKMAEKRESNAGSLTAGGRSVFLVQFNLELRCLKHRHSID